MFVIFAVAAALSACAGVPERAHYRPAPGSYVTVTVREGDTVSEIADRYNVDVDDIAAMNRLDDPDVLVAGQVLRVPAYGRVARYAPSPRPDTWQPSYMPPRRPARQWQPAASTPEREARVVPPHRPPSTAPMPIPKPHRLDPPPEESAPVRTASLPPADAVGPAHGERGEFIWPLDGVVVSSFGARANGERNDGINIAATGGEDIRAAADGTITYAGNELKGYGNLVLIKHANGFTTAYAHLDRIEVARGQHVQKGQVIATAGASGDVSEPQLHFELRRGVRPVDPRPYLATYGL